MNDIILYIYIYIYLFNEKILDLVLESNNKLFRESSKIFGQLALKFEQLCLKRAKILQVRLQFNDFLLEVYETSRVLHRNVI